MEASKINLKEEFKLANLKEPFCAALDEALRFFLEPKGRAHIVRGFKEAGILDCFGSGAEALYAKALAANDAGTLFPGGKNTNIDVSIDSTIEDVPEDAQENQNPMQQRMDNIAQELASTIAGDLFDILGPE